MTAISYIPVELKDAAANYYTFAIASVNEDFLHLLDYAVSGLQREVADLGFDLGNYPNGAWTIIDGRPTYTLTFGWDVGLTREHFEVLVDRDESTLSYNGSQLDCIITHHYTCIEVLADVKVVAKLSANVPEDYASLLLATEKVKYELPANVSGSFVAQC